MALALSKAPSNGEVEGPDDHAGQAPRAHTVFPRPRRPTTGASRPPRTIVRHHDHSLPKMMSPYAQMRVPTTDRTKVQTSIVR